MTGGSQCVLDPVLKAVTRRWSASLLWQLCSNGPMRSGVLMRSIPGASVKVLTEHLRDLEEQRLVQRSQLGNVPSEVTYAISERGLELRTILEAMRCVAERWAAIDALRAKELIDEGAFIAKKGGVGARDQSQRYPS